MVYFVFWLKNKVKTVMFKALWLFVRGSEVNNNGNFPLCICKSNISIKMKRAIKKTKKKLEV